MINWKPMRKQDAYFPEGFTCRVVRVHSSGEIDTFRPYGFKDFLPLLKARILL